MRWMNLSLYLGHTGRRVRSNFVCGEAYTVELGSEETIQVKQPVYTDKILNFLGMRGSFNKSTGENQ